MSNTIINGGASPYPKHVGPAAICSFSDGAQDAPLKSLKFYIEPSQDLHGYSYPWPAGGGVNKFDGSAVTTTHSSNWGIDWNATTNVLTITQKTSYTTGTPTFSLNLPSGTYVASYQSISETGKISLYTDGSWVKSLNNGVTFTIDSTKTNEIRFAAVTVTKFQIESGSTATAYAPYSNICPISGWTQMDAAAAGKNIISPSMAEIGTAWNGAPNSARARLVVQCKPSTKYTISMNGTSSMSNIFRQDSAAVPASSVGGDITNLMPYTFTTGASSKYIIVAFSKTGITQADINALKLQIEEGGTNTDYENTATPITIALGQTVYGGTLDVKSGKLTVDKGYATISAFSSKSGATANMVYAYQGITSTVKKPSADSVAVDLLSDKFVKSNFGSTGGLYSTDKAGIAVNTNGTLYVGFGKNGVSTLADANTWVAANPIQVVYPLATPIEVDLAPVSVSSLLGQNNIWCNTGDTELDYYPAAASVVAVMNKSSKVYTSIPLGKIRYDTYQTTPNQALDLDSYRAETGVLIRNVLSHTATKIEFNTPSMTNAQWEEVWNIIKAGFNNSTERKLKLKYYDQMSATYKTGWFYVPDVQFTIRNIDEANGIINYDEVRVAFIEY